MRKRCNKCNIEYNDGSTFCSNCGSRLEEIKEFDKNEEAPYKSGEKIENSENNNERNEETERTEDKSLKYDKNTSHILKDMFLIKSEAPFANKLKYMFALCPAFIFVCMFAAFVSVFHEYYIYGISGDFAEKIILTVLAYFAFGLIGWGVAYFIMCVVTRFIVSALTKNKYYLPANVEDEKQLMDLVSKRLNKRFFIAEKYTGIVNEGITYKINAFPSSGYFMIIPRPTSRIVFGGGFAVRCKDYFIMLKDIPVIARIIQSELWKYNPVSEDSFKDNSLLYKSNGLLRIVVVAAISVLMFCVTLYPFNYFKEIKDMYVFTNPDKYDENKRKESFDRLPVIGQTYALQNVHFDFEGEPTFDEIIQTVLANSYWSYDSDRELITVTGDYYDHDSLSNTKSQMKITFYLDGINCVGYESVPKEKSNIYGDFISDAESISYFKNAIFRAYALGSNIGKVMAGHDIASQKIAECNIANNLNDKYAIEGVFMRAVELYDLLCENISFFDATTKETYYNNPYYDEMWKRYDELYSEITDVFDRSLADKLIDENIYVDEYENRIYTGKRYNNFDSIQNLEDPSDMVFEPVAYDGNTAEFKIRELGGSERECSIKMIKEYDGWKISQFEWWY